MSSKITVYSQFSTLHKACDSLPATPGFAGLGGSLHSWWNVTTRKYSSELQNPGNSVCHQTVIHENSHYDVSTGKNRVTVQIGEHILTIKWKLDRDERVLEAV